MPRNSSNSSVDLTQKAFSGIRQMLFHSEIVAGQKIPFKELADEMGMSVTPVIQALKFLEFQGLVRREPNKGYFLEALSLDEIRELYAFRELLESSLLEETINRLDKEAEKQLQEAHQSYLEALSGVFISKKLVADMNFHLTIARLSGQSLRLQALRNVFDILHLKYQSSLRYVTSSRSNEQDHGHILEAILARDTTKAKRLLVAHIRSSGKHAYNNVSRMMKEKAEMQI